MGLTIYGWKWLLFLIGPPGLLIGAWLLWRKEPPRRGWARQGQALPGREVAREIWARKRVYLPLFIGLAFSALESQGLQAWRAPFMVRTYGWTEAQIGAWSGPMFLVFSLLGVVLGTAVTERLARRYKDANVRTTTLMFACAVPFAVASPLMPNGELALLCSSVGGMFGLASAVPQNAAIQRITPNEMRGQVTAIYLFMFTFFGAMGSLVIGTIAQRVIGDEAELWKAMALTAAVLMPLAAFSISRGIKPYRQEIERLEAQENR